MNFRHVVPKWQRLALLLQVLLCSLMLCYVVFAIKQIIDSSASPPVETSVLPWNKGLGKWALCEFFEPWDLEAVGTSQRHHVWDFDDRKEALTGAKVSGPNTMESGVYQVDGGDDIVNCAFMDLSNAEVTSQTEFHFTLCLAVHSQSGFFLWTGDQWKLLTVQYQGDLKWFSLTKIITGWNYGYSVAENETFLTSSMDQPWTWNADSGIRGGDRRYMCAAGLQNFTQNASPKYRAAAIHLTVPTATVVAYYKQGVLPQLFKLFGNIGGYITFLTVAFTFCFIKKYPDSSVSQIHNARTFAFENMLPSGKSGTDNCSAAEPRPTNLPPGMYPALQRDTE